MNDAIDVATTMGVEALLVAEAERIHAPGHDHSGACANCGTRLTGPFCHVCGQHGHVHRTIGAFGHDILHGVFHFEGKFWATLPLLAWRPGELTRRYARGERAKFVSPMAMFLFSVFLLFAVVANLPGWHVGEGAFSPDLTGSLDQTRERLADEAKKATDRIDSRTRRLAKLQGETPDEDTAHDLAEVRQELGALQATRGRIAAAQRYLPPPDAAKGDEADQWLSAKVEHARRNPDLVFYKVKSSAYKYSWALIPLSLPFIWLLFPFRRDVGFYDHAVFATYSLSFMSLLVVVAAVLAAIGVPGWIVGIAWLVPPVHLYRQLRGAYRLGRLGALWRTFWMLVFACITSTLFVILLAYLGTAD